MSTSLATGLCVLAILGLFYLNRDKSVPTSKALWIPVIWFWISYTRPVTSWLNGGLVPESTTASKFNTMMEGSPTDRLVFQILIAIALIIVASRGRRAGDLLKANWPVTLYYSYCLLSVVWSDFPDVAAKRWVKSLADIAMMLIVVSDDQPATAMRRLFSRVAFVFIPGSLLFIKYYPQLGRAYDSWTGEPFNTGLTTNKNMLGVITFILTLGIWWQFLRLWRDKGIPDRKRQLVAEGIALGAGLWLLSEAHSATSGTCFAIGAALVLVTGLGRFKGRPSAVQRLVLTFAVVGSLIKLTGADAIVVQWIGRKPDLTGRPEIWAVVVPMAPNRLIGAGFESFWLGPRLLYIWSIFTHMLINEAHNGYIEVYLNLGLVGVALIVLILIDSYRRAIVAFRIDPDSAGLMLAFVLTSVIYSYTEAGFRMLDATWTFLLWVSFAAARASQLAARKAGVQTLPPSKRTRVAEVTSSSDSGLGEPYIGRSS